MEGRDSFCQQAGHAALAAALSGCRQLGIRQGLAGSAHAFSPTLQTVCLQHTSRTLAGLLDILIGFLWPAASLTICAHQSGQGLAGLGHQ